MLDFSIPEVQPDFTIEQILHRDDITKNVSFDSETQTTLDVQSAIADNIKILSKVPLPSHINKDSLEKYIQKLVEGDFQKDPLFKKATKLSKYANNFNKFFNLYFEEVFDFHRDLINDLQNKMLSYSNLFIESDLPSVFIKELNFSVITEIKTVEIVDKRMRRERLRIFGTKNNQIKFNRICNEHNEWIKPLIEKLGEMKANQIILIWYLDFQNSSNTTEVFKAKKIKVEKLNTEVFYKLLNNLQLSTSELRKLIIKYDKETFLSSIPSNDVTFKLFANLVPIIMAG